MTKSRAAGVSGGDTAAELRRLALAATTGPWPWIRPWGAFTVHAIGNDDVLSEQRNLDLAVAAVNALPALLDRMEALEAALRTAMAGMEHSRDGVCSMTGAEHAALAKAHAALVLEHRPMTTTDRAYARCVARGGHRYGTETVRRNYLGHDVELRTCLRCRVPETPKFRHLNLGVLRRPRDVILSYRDD